MRITHKPLDTPDNMVAIKPAMDRMGYLTLSPGSVITLADYQMGTALEPLIHRLQLRDEMQRPLPAVIKACLITGLL